MDDYRIDDLYRDYILEHYKNPRNSGVLEAPDVSYQESNPLCGDEIRIDLKLTDSTVNEVRFKGKGCAISQASASLLTERIKGMSLEEIKRLGRVDILEELGVERISPTRLKCALLSLKVLRAGLFGLKGWPDDEA